MIVPLSAPTESTTPADQPLGLTAADLPRWMRRARRGLDWGALLVLLLGMAAAWPFIVHPALSTSNQHEQFVHRAANMAQAFSEGLLYVRWSPHALYGYGAPVPSFTPPLPDYLTGTIQFFITGDAVTAVRIAFSLTLLLSGLGVYALLLRRRDASTGVIGAALYLLSPVVAVTAPHTVGALDVSLALALLPALLWSVDRLLIAAAPSDWALVSLLTAGLLLTHPLLAVCGVLLSLAYAVWLIGFSGVTVRRPLLLIAALLIGGGLAAGYWLPAVLETEFVRWLPPVQPLPTFTWPLLFAPFPLTDPAAVNPPPVFAPGLIGVLIGTLTGALLIRRRCLAHISFYGWQAAPVIVGVLLLLPDYGWLTGGLSLLLAISAAGLPDLLTDRPGYRRILGAGLLGLGVIAAYPIMLLPAPPARTIDPTPAGQIAYQMDGFGSPVVPRSAAHPVTLADPIQPDLRLTSSYATGISGAAVIESSSGGTFITPLETGTQSERFQVQTSEGARLRLLLAAFPGWEATLSGEPLPLTTDPTGMLIAELPPYASGELSVRLGTSPARGIGWLIAGLSGVLLVAGVRWRRLPAVEPPELRLLPAPISRLYGLTIGLFTLFMIAAHFSTAQLGGSPAGGNHGLRPPLTLLNATTPAGITLIGATVPETLITQSSDVPVTLYWTASQPVTADYRAHVFLINLSTGSRWAFTSTTAPGSYPTLRWQPGGYVIDDRMLRIPHNLPYDWYTIGVELFACTPDCTLAQRQTFRVDGTDWGNTLVLPLRIGMRLPRGG